MSLNLSVAEELALEENLDLLLKLGFRIEVDPLLPSTKRVAVLAMPYFEKLRLGRDDIREIMGRVANGEGMRSFCCTKVMRMYASMACRSSVMIGTALSRGKMDEILQNLSKLVQPWNCPHGRPTIRHLCQIASSGERGRRQKKESENNTRAAQQ